jgi:hypothetical protein
MFAFSATIKIHKGSSAGSTPMDFPVVFTKVAGNSWDFLPGPGDFPN